MASGQPPPVAVEEKQRHDAQHQHDLIVFGHVDDAQRRAGHLGRDALDHLLVGVVAGRKVKRRLAQLDGRDEDKAQQKARHQRHGAGGGLDDLADMEGAGRQIKAHRHQQHQRLVGHHLDHLAPRAQRRKRRGIAGGGHDQEHVGRRKQKRAHEDVRPREQHRARNGKEHKIAQVQQHLHAVDRDHLLGEQLAQVVIRLQQRRARAALHAGGNFAVQPVQQHAGGRGQHQVGNDRNNRQHHTAPPMITQSMTTSTPVATMTDGRISRRMPNSNRRYQLLRYRCSGSP